MKQITIKHVGDNYVCWKNILGQYHNENGPAIIMNHSVEYFINGKCHREDGPAIECANGDKWWYKEGKLHREDGPAIECTDGSKWWYKEGKLHREDGPAIEWTDGRKEYCLNGEYLSYITNDAELIIKNIIE